MRVEATDRMNKALEPRTTPTRRGRTIAALIGAGSLVLAACSGDDSGEAAPTTLTTERAAVEVEAIGVPHEQAQAAAERALADPRVAELLSERDITAVRVTPVPRAAFSNVEGHEFPAKDGEYVYVDAAITPAFDDREFQASVSTETAGGVCGITPEEPGALTGLAWSIELEGMRIGALTPTWADGAGDCFAREP